MDRLCPARTSAIGCDAVVRAVSQNRRERLAKIAASLSLETLSMRRRTSLRSSLAATAALAAAQAVAQSSPTDDARGAWMLGLGAEVDEQESDSVLANLYVGVGSSTWLT